ncbi:hypothetical protein [Brevundimonas sp.]|uniref:hypothetical protein n=1 Tax=Brevundimonas sp. TaxID=1871086 RepID=UPI0035AFB2A4
MQPIIVTSEADTVRILAERRKALGLTVLELDAKAGFQEQYSGKLEHPEQHWGRGSISISGMAEIWLEALGMRLVLMTEEDAERIGAVVPPRKPRSKAEPKRPIGRPVVFQRRYVRPVIGASAHA